MKALSALLTACTLSLSLQATAKCDRLEMYDMANLHASIEKDLTSNVWSSSLLGAPATIYFEQEGIALVMKEGEARMESFTWALHRCDGRPLLQLFCGTTCEEFYLSPTCNGLAAACDGKSTSMLLGSEKGISAEHMAFLQSQMTGTWHFRTAKQAKRNAATPFTLSLGNDGLFTLHAGPDSYHSTREGVWQLSPDGQYLILFSEVYVDGKKKFIPESMAIRALDFEDLVVDGKCLPRVLESRQGKKPLYFEKA